MHFVWDTEKSVPNFMPLDISTWIAEDLLETTFPWIADDLQRAPVLVVQGCVKQDV